MRFNMHPPLHGMSSQTLYVSKPSPRQRPILPYLIAVYGIGLRNGMPEEVGIDAFLDASGAGAVCDNRLHRSSRIARMPVALTQG
jgi:hypothetical protein